MDDSKDLESRRKELEIRRARLAAIRAARSGNQTQPSKTSLAQKNDTLAKETILSRDGGNKDKTEKRKVVVTNDLVLDVQNLSVNVEPVKQEQRGREGLLKQVSGKYAADILGEDESSRGRGKNRGGEGEGGGSGVSDLSGLLVKNAVLGGSEKARGRGISCLRWHPKYEHLVIASYARTSRVPAWELDDECGMVMMWSLERTGSKEPDRLLRAHAEVLAIETLSIAAPTVLVGALYSGEIVMWDTRLKRSLPVRQTYSDASFQELRMPVYNLCSSSNDSAIISGSRDGTVSIWSPSNFSKPCETFCIRRPTSRQSISIMALDVPNSARFGEGGASESGKSTFFAGDDSGNLYRIGNAPKRSVEIEHQGHDSPTLSLSCHPAGVRWPQFSDVVLSSSMDWTSGLWTLAGGKCKKLTSFDMPVVGSVADAQWSPTHPGIFAAADGDAGISTFDLSKTPNDQQATRLSTAMGDNKSDAMINKIRWSKDGKQLAAGDVSGRVHIYNANSYVIEPPSTVWEDVASQIRSWHASNMSEP